VQLGTRERRLGQERQELARAFEYRTFAEIKESKQKQHKASKVYQKYPDRTSIPRKW
jgi:hypothetical protein